MRKMIFVIFAILGTVPILGAGAVTPFDVTSDGVTIQSHQLDYETMSIIFAVEVSESPGTLKIAFDRDFFDAIYQGHDDEFLIIVDGELISYSEVRNTPYYRTIQFELHDGVDEVEIFGTTLKGQIIEQNTESLFDNDVINSQQSEQELDENEEAVNQIEQLEAENLELNNENEELEKKIFNPNNLMAETGVQANNLMSETEVQANNLNSFIMKQVDLMTSWIKSFF